MNHRGEWVKAPAWDVATAWSEGLMPVQVDEVWGYVDRDGKQIIAPRFERANDFVDGLAAVRIEGQWRLIDRAGKVVEGHAWPERVAWRDDLGPTFRGY